MYLTKEEERVLNGEHGWANQVSMKILVRLGDLFGATKLIPIRSAHLSGVSYKHLGDATIDFLDSVAQSGGKAQTPTSLNPAGFDPDYLRKKFSKERLEKQQHIINLYEQMGINPSLTCTPYYLSKPRHGQHLAWAESSAVVYANSVLGAWTNREGSPSALAAALIGKTPDYGVHKAENRQPNVLVMVKTKLGNEAEYGALGIHLGKLLKDKIPLIEGLDHSSKDDLKQLGAGMASSGMTTMFYTKNVRRKYGLEKVSVEAFDVQETASNLCTTDEKPDMVFIGCPHCSLREIKSVAEFLAGKQVRMDVELWVCVSRHVKEKARESVHTIEEAGGLVLCDTCAIVTWIKDLGVRTLMTNSAKTAFYAPTLSDVDVTLKSLSECLKAVCKN